MVMASKPKTSLMLSSGVDDFAVAFDNAADDVALLAGAVEHGLAAFEAFRRDDDDEADAHVEGAQHLLLLDIAEVLEVLEDGQHRPAAEFDMRRDGAGQDAGQVLRDAAAGDVRHARHVVAGGELFDEAE